MRLSVLFPFPPTPSIVDHRHSETIAGLSLAPARSFASTVSLTPKSFLHGTLSRRICPRSLPRNYAPFPRNYSANEEKGQLDNAQTTLRNGPSSYFIERATFEEKNGLLLRGSIKLPLFTLSGRALISRAHLARNF